MADEAEELVQEEAPSQEETDTFDADAERERIKAELAAEFAEKERSLQKGFREIAERERALTPQPEETIPDLDPEAEKAITALIEKKYGAQLHQSTEVLASLAERELAKAAADKGVDAAELRSVIEEYGLVTKPGLDGVTDAIEKAYNIHRALNFNPEAELERLREQQLEEAADGVRIEGITPKRGASAAASSEDVHEMTTAERLAYYAEKYPDL